MVLEICSVESGWWVKRWWFGWKTGSESVCCLSSLFEVRLLLVKLCRCVRSPFVGSFTSWIELFVRCRLLLTSVKRSTTIHMKMRLICMWMKSHFHTKGWAPWLALRKRLKILLRNGKRGLAIFYLQKLNRDWWEQTYWPNNLLIINSILSSLHASYTYK